MAIDMSEYKNNLRKNNPNINLVPLIDVIFIILIFLMVTSSFQAASQPESSSGKPEIEASGPSEYYLIPVAGLKKVLVNGEDMSSYIKNNAIAVHTRVINEGEIIIRSKNGMIIITTPPDLPANKAVITPKQ